MSVQAKPTPCIYYNLAVLSFEKLKIWTIGVCEREKQRERET